MEQIKLYKKFFMNVLPQGAGAGEEAEAVGGGGAWGWYKIHTVFFSFLFFQKIVKLCKTLYLYINPW